MRIEIVRNKDKSWHWRLVANNNRILAHSETYVKESSALNTAMNVAKQARLKVIKNKKTLADYTASDISADNGSD